MNKEFLKYAAILCGATVILACIAYSVIGFLGA